MIVWALRLYIARIALHRRKKQLEQPELVLSSCSPSIEYMLHLRALSAIRTVGRSKPHKDLAGIIGRSGDRRSVHVVHDSFRAPASAPPGRSSRNRSVSLPCRKFISHEEGRSPLLLLCAQKIKYIRCNGSFERTTGDSCDRRSQGFGTVL